MEPTRLERSKKTATFHVFRNLNSHQELFVEKKIQSKSIAIILGRKCLAKKIIEYSAWWKAGWHFTFFISIQKKGCLRPESMAERHFLFPFNGILYFHNSIFPPLPLPSLTHRGHFILSPSFYIFFLIYLTHIGSHL